MCTGVLFLTLQILVSMAVPGCPISAGRTELPSNFMSRGSVQPIKEMNADRAAHTATLLNDGRVLIAGGFGNDEQSLTRAELFDPSSSSFSTTDDLDISRAGHSATLLPNGKVLIAGGYNGEYLDSSEIYDPKTGQFTRGERMTVARSGHTATTLSDGSILLAGGVGKGWSFLAEAEVYDPLTGKFAAVGSMTTPRESHTATLLNDGRVLIAGGHKDRRANITIFSSTEVYDFRRRIFEPSSDMTMRRHKHDAVLLNDGRVLIAGGSDERDGRPAYTSMEQFDPATGRFRKAGDMRSARYKLQGTVVVLSNGKVLLAGGSDRAEVFDPSRGVTDVVAGTFGTKRLFATATRLKNDRVLITGGYDDSLKVGSGAWVYNELE